MGNEMLSFITKLIHNPDLTCRIETPIEASLLIPILSVLNESSLYSSWIPSWTMPKMGIDSSEQLEQVSRGSQIIRILANVPWPYSKREALIKAVAIDEIDERGFVAIRISSDVPVGGIIPPPSPQVERIDFEGAMLLRPCPRNHELLLKSKHVYREPLILVSFKMFADPRMTGIPTTFMNFVTRTAIGTIFFCFLDVAEAVKHGKRPKHMEAIAEKKDFYDWMALRIGILLEKAAVHDVLPPISKYMNEAKTSELEAHQAFISYLQSWWHFFVPASWRASIPFVTPGEVICDRAPYRSQYLGGQGKFTNSVIGNYR